MEISANTVARLLHDVDFSLRVNRKAIAADFSLHIPLIDLIVFTFLFRIPLRARWIMIIHSEVQMQRRRT